MEKINFENLPSTNTPINANNLNQLQNNVEEAIDLVHPIGAVLITNANTNPSSKLGGTWKLINKEFSSTKNSDTGSGNYFNKNTTNVGDYGLYFVRNGNSIDVRLMVKNNVELGDDKVILGNILFESLGFSQMYYSLYSHLGGTDGGNAVVQCNLMYDTGEVSANDVVHKTTGSNVAVNSEIYFEFSFTVPMEYMLDSACDKFYWKRTA